MTTVRCILIYTVMQSENSFTTFKEFSLWALVSHKEYRCLVLHLHEDLRNDLFVADIMVSLAHCYRKVQVKLQL